MLAAGAGRVIGFDRDPDAIANGPSLVPDPRLTLIEERFSQMDAGARRARPRCPSTACARYRRVARCSSTRPSAASRSPDDGPLDMRMSQSGQTAAEFLNEADEAEIARVISDYGEEPRARKVARAIVAARPLTRTAELAAVVRKALGHHAGHEERPRDAHLPGDPHPPQCRARRARGGPARRRALAARRRPARGRHLPQPRGPHRQALPARAQRQRPRPDRATARSRRPGPSPSFEQVAKPVSPSDARAGP